MYTKQDLIAHLSDLRIDPAGTLMVHISCRAVGEVEGRGDTILDALSEYMRPGLLVLPSHTWDIVNAAPWTKFSQSNPVMDVLHTPSNVGVLTEIFRKRPGVLRSLHPTHSLAALGVDAGAFLSGEEHIQTPCGMGGAYYRLWARGAQILLIGVSFIRNTYIHGIEEWDGAQGTLSPEKTDLYVINYEGYRLHTPQRRHIARLGSETFSKLEPEAQQQGVLTLGRFGDATARVMGARPLRAMVAAILKEDPLYLSKY